MERPVPVSTAAFVQQLLAIIDETVLPLLGAYALYLLRSWILGKKPK